MNFSYLLGVFTSWIAFTDEGHKFGNKVADSAVKYLNKYLKEDKKK